MRVRGLSPTLTQCLAERDRMAVIRAQGGTGRRQAACAGGGLTNERMRPCVLARADPEGKRSPHNLFSEVAPLPFPLAALPR